jgi:gluconolactonase
MALLSGVSVLSFILGQVLAQSGIVSPLAQACPGYTNNTDVVCINRYASSMPPTFSRQSSTGGVFYSNDTFVDTQVPADPSFQLVKNATR